jgi:hypothetical protein
MPCGTPRASRWRVRGRTATSRAARTACTPLGHIGDTRDRQRVSRDRVGARGAARASSPHMDANDRRRWRSVAYDSLSALSSQRSAVRALCERTGVEPCQAESGATADFASVMPILSVEPDRSLGGRLRRRPQIGNCIELPRAGHAFERPLTSVFELDPGASDKILDRSGNQNLAGASQ